MPLKFGKKPARHGAIQLSLAQYLDYPNLPTPPDDFGYDMFLPADSGVLGNDVAGNCCFAGADHETMLWNGLAGTDVAFEASDALADYTAVTGYDPRKPDTDQGADMQKVAEYRRTTGMLDVHGRRHQIGAYAAMQAGNLGEHKLATWIFGAVGVGVMVSEAQEEQFNAGVPWIGPLGGNRGGHYCPLIGFRGGYLLFVTWGKVQRVTPEYFSDFNDESIAFFSTEMLKSGLGPTGLDLTTLQADLTAITSPSVKGLITMPTPTPPALIAQRLAAAQAAFAAYVSANIPGWEAKLLPADKIQAAIVAVVEAIDAVRNAQPAGGTA